MSSHQQDSSSQQPFRWHYAELDDADFEIRGRTLFSIIALFSAVLVIALLFLYARWVCRFAPHPPPPQPTPTLSAARGTHAPRRGLERAAIDALPIALHRSDSSGEAECCICLGLFSDGDKVKFLPACEHCFHSECVDRWLTTQSSCPLCRASLLVDSPV